MVDGSRGCGLLNPGCGGGEEWGDEGLTVNPPESKWWMEAELTQAAGSPLQVVEAVCGVTGGVMRVRTRARQRRAPRVQMVDESQAIASSTQAAKVAKRMRTEARRRAP